VVKRRKKKVCVCMIQPINTLTPKVFRGKSQDLGLTAKQKTARNIALANAAGISIVTGAVVMAGGRCYASSWRHAGVFGAIAAAVTMMFTAPAFLYRLGLSTHQVKKEGAEVQKKIGSVIRKAA